jgi:hypothetical protein
MADDKHHGARALQHRATSVDQDDMEPQFRWSAAEPEHGDKPESYLLLLIHVFRDTATAEWVGHCEELHLTGVGNDREDALDATLEAVELHLNALEALGLREATLKDFGLELSPFEPTEPRKLDLQMVPGDLVTYERVVLVDA